MRDISHPYEILAAYYKPTPGQRRSPRSQTKIFFAKFGNTNSNLRLKVEGYVQILEDLLLYYRLAGYPVKVAPLRERTKDITPQDA